MALSPPLSLFISLALSIGTISAQTLGSNTDLQVRDGLVNPDGFLHQAILVQNLFPAPAILGTKVRELSTP